MEFICAWCKKIYVRHPSYAKKQKHCGYACKTAARRRRKDNPFKWINKKGYVVLNFWDDDGKKYKQIFEHRVVWGQPVPKGFVIHHINENPSDNRIENLQLMSLSEHTRLHKRDFVKYPKTKGTPAQYAKNYRMNNPNYRIEHAARERARRARLKAEKLKT